jgi:hypothetical protein
MMESTVQTAADAIPLTSFLTFFALQLLGAIWHYRVVCKDGRHFGGIWSYLTGEYKTTTLPVFFALLGSSVLAASTGTADFVNPELVWATLKANQLPGASLTIAYLIFQGGYQWDSNLNRGDNGPK